MITTVRGRLALINSLILLLALALSSALFYLQLEARFATRDQERVDQRMKSVIAIINQNPDIDRERLLNMLGELSGMRLEALPPDSRMPVPVPTAAMPGPVLMQDGRVVAYLKADNLVSERDLAHQAFWASLLWVTLPSFLLAAAAGLLLSRAVTRPLAGLAAATAAMGSGNLGARAPEEGPRELRELAGQVNRMAERLADAFAARERERDRLKQLIADLSHELKTPLTALRSFTELMAADLDESPTAHPDHRRFVAESQRQLERLQWLIQTLLDLSRLDAGFIRIAPRLEPLATTAGRVITAFEPRARERSVALAVEIDPGLLAWHDGRWVEQALANLVDNSLRFTPPGTTVTVSARRQGDEVALTVSDTGPGIPPEEQPHLFERFYRGTRQPAGSRGSGLGLAIVQAVAAAHGGRVSVQSEPGAG
ncbi:MAG: HAMP domain-containing sensor histidine kinase, partial [Bacillota bacterium]